LPHLDALDVVVVDVGGPTEAARVATAVQGGVAVVVAEAGATLDEVVERVRTAEPSMTVLSADALRHARGTLRATTRRSPVAAYPRLTPREREVLGTVCRTRRSPAPSASASTPPSSTSARSSASWAPAAAPRR